MYDSNLTEVFIPSISFHTIKDLHYQDFNLHYQDFNF